MHCHMVTICVFITNSQKRISEPTHIIYVLPVDTTFSQTYLIQALLIGWAEIEWTLEKSFKLWCDRLVLETCTGCPATSPLLLDKWVYILYEHMARSLKLQKYIYIFNCSHLIVKDKSRMANQGPWDAPAQLFSNHLYTQLLLCACINRHAAFSVPRFFYVFLKNLFLCFPFFFY